MLDCFTNKEYRVLKKLSELVWGINCFVLQLSLKVSVNENLSKLLDFVFFGFLAWVGPKFNFGRKRKAESAF